MAEVTGPISTLAGFVRAVPEGTMCDEHPTVLAVKRIQGETDSMGSEQHDMCQVCVDKHNAYLASEQAVQDRMGTCEWCKGGPLELFSRRDYDEGSSGRVYQVCRPCIKRDNERAAEELAADREEFGDWDD